VVQIINNENINYGLIFTIGDIRHGRAHGYHFLMGKKGGKDFVTVNCDECWVIGPSKVRSNKPISPKWQSDHS